MPGRIIPTAETMRGSFCDRLAVWGKALKAIKQHWEIKFQHKYCVEINLNLKLKLYNFPISVKCVYYQVYNDTPIEDKKIYIS